MFRKLVLLPFISLKKKNFFLAALGLWGCVQVCATVASGGASLAVVHRPLIVETSLVSEQGL